MLSYTLCLDSGMAAQAIRDARDRAGLSQAELGEKIGVDAMTVSRWERGESLPRRGLWPKIKEVTGVELGLVGTLPEMQEQGAQ